MAIEISDTTSMQAGKSMRPSFLSGFVRSATRCTSHFVSETTLAKPIAEQMAMMRVAFVIDLSNCLKAIIGSSESSAIKIPAESRTRRVSQRLISAAIAPIVTTSATPMDHVILRYSFGWEETTVGRALFRFFFQGRKAEDSSEI